MRGAFYLSPAMEALLMSLLGQTIVSVEHHW